MGLFDGIFSGSAGRRTARMNAGLATDYQSQIDALLRQGQSEGVNALTGGRADQLLALRGGYDTSRGDYQRARDLYNPYATTGLAAWNQMADAAGVNGGAGYDRATAAFRASPGYQWQMTQSLDQANRAAAAAGQLQSGNAAAELQDRASRLADQEYGQYYNRLQGVSDRGYDAVNRQAGIDQDMGRLAYGYGQNQAGVYGDTAAKLAALYSGTAGQRSNTLTNLTSQLIDANKFGYQSGRDAATNKLNFLLGLGNMAASAAGAYWGGGKKS